MICPGSALTSHYGCKKKLSVRERQEIQCQSQEKRWQSTNEWQRTNSLNGGNTSVPCSTTAMVNLYQNCHSCCTGSSHRDQSTYTWGDSFSNWPNEEEQACRTRQCIEALQHGGDAMYSPWLLFSTLIPPSQWTTSVIVPLPKKGDLSLMTNYRGISLLSITAKVYNKILLNRIRDHVDPILRSNQAGFRSGRSCAQQIHILRIVEGFQDYQPPLTVTFIDFKKAFDSINRKVIFAVLRHYGIPEPLVNAIGALYNNSKSAVMVDGNISETFKVSTGVLQGDVLAPSLFIILVDCLLKKATSDLDSGAVTHPRRSRRYPVKVLNDLDFVDDIALLESTTD